MGYILSVRDMDITTEIRRMISAVILKGSKNKLTPTEIKTAFLDYLESYAAEVNRFPETAEDDHWNLIMADFNPTEPALYFAIAFVQDQAILCCGTGKPYDIRNYAETEFAEEASTIPDELFRRFGNPFQKMTIARQELETWLFSKK